MPKLTKITRWYPFTKKQKIEPIRTGYYEVRTADHGWLDACWIDGSWWQYGICGGVLRVRQEVRNVIKWRGLCYDPGVPS